MNNKRHVQSAVAMFALSCGRSFRYGHGTNRDTEYTGLGVKFEQNQPLKPFVGVFHAMPPPARHQQGIIVWIEKVVSWFQRTVSFIRSTLHSREVLTQATFQGQRSQSLVGQLLEFRFGHAEEGSREFVDCSSWMWERDTRFKVAREMRVVRRVHLRDVIKEIGTSWCY
jgi:hypothetical protein